MQVIISGTGCVTCAGHSPSELFKAALHGQHGLSSDPENGLTLGVLKEGLLETLIPGLTGHGYFQTLFPNGLPAGPRVKPLLYLYASLFQAMDTAGWNSIPARTGFIFATTTGYVPYWEQDLVDYDAKRMPAEAFRQSFKDHPLSRPLDPLYQAGFAMGPLRILTSACAAGTQGLALAHQWIKSGKVDRCIVGGTELLSTLTIRGFNSLGLISKTPCAPFDQDRDGINLSEAAGVVLLERSNLATNRLAVLSGGGMSLDSYDMTSPDPSGAGIAKAISGAFAGSGVSTGGIDWIHTHGTGSTVNDLAEAAAAVKIFGEQTPPVSSTKGLHGHALAASGIIESALCIEAMRHGTIIGTLNHKTTDEKISANIQKENVAQNIRHILKTTLGFGGVNASVILSNAEYRS